MYIVAILLTQLDYGYATFPT